MISPQYTPFTGSEVRKALAIPPSVYADALGSSLLLRSVHFDGRVSDVTALHSLVDVVRFDLLFSNSGSNSDQAEFERDCEAYLDDFCALFGDDREVERLTKEGTTLELISYIDPIAGEVARSGKTGVWTGETTILFDVAESWCQCYRALALILTTDTSNYDPYRLGQVYYS